MDSEVDIEADGLRELLKEMIGSDYPGQNFDGETVNICAPFAPLVCLTQSVIIVPSGRKALNFFKFLTGFMSCQLMVHANQP